MKTKLEFNSQKVRDTLAVAGHLIACYLASRAGLKELGILRTERTLQGDYAEWLVANLLNLKLSPSTIEKHIDAMDAEGKTYQIKSRIVSSMTQSTSFDFRSSELIFDFLIAVFLDQKFDVLAVLQVPREAVIALSHKNASSFRFRWNRACADDARVERLFWRDHNSSKINLE
ncbi:MAG TPA: hypothetical protein VMD27_10170 [Candidatus Aquilonibacter sp.]|nr:hypothetical protein [Candidatus Aquilonibacter sp.]